MRGISRKLALFSFLAAIGLAAFLAGMVAKLGENLAIGRVERLTGASVAS